VAAFDPGDEDCSSGLSGEIYTRWTSDPNNGFAKLTPAIERLLKSQCFAIASAVAASFVADAVPTWKKPVRAKWSGSGPLEGQLQYAVDQGDPVSLEIGDRVLVMDRADSSENGVYEFIGVGQGLQLADDGTRARGDVVYVLEDKLTYVLSTQPTLPGDRLGFVYELLPAAGGTTPTTSAVTEVVLATKCTTKRLSTASFVAGAGAWLEAHHDTSGTREVRLHVVVMSTGGSAVRVRLWSVADAAYVSNLDGANNYLETNSVNEVVLVSDDLRTATNFDPSNNNVYRVVLQSTNTDSRVALFSARLVVEEP
jgi:hypothetical protein